MTRNDIALVATVVKEVDNSEIIWVSLLLPIYMYYQGGLLDITDICIRNQVKCSMSFKENNTWCQIVLCNTLISKTSLIRVHDIHNTHSITHFRLPHSNL